MPSTGTPRSKTPGSTAGAPGSYTDAGPPDRITPAGRFALRSERGRSCATISEYTWHSRTRRAISCAYWAPRSTTSTGCGPDPPVASIVATRPPYQRRQRGSSVDDEPADLPVLRHRADGGRRRKAASRASLDLRAPPEQHRARENGHEPHSRRDEEDAFVVGARRS